MTSADKLPLNDGFDMPAVGLACFRRDSIKDTKEIINHAVHKGIRHFEISELYGNANVIVDCIMNNQMQRDELFITMKIWPKNRNKEELMASFHETLSGSGLDYVDLLLIHAPIDVENRVQHWKAVEAIKQGGFARSIGLAYMTNIQLGDLIKHCTIIPAVLEMEFSPFGQNEEVVEFCQDNAIAVIVDQPFVKCMRHRHPELLALSEQLGITVDELLIRYITSKDMGIYTQPTHFCDPQIHNTNSLRSRLSEDVMARLNALEEGLYSAWDPKEDLGDDIK